MSPNHPNNYPNNYNKVFFFLITFVLKNYVKVITLQTWQLQSGQEFTLTFDSFDIWRCIKDGENQSLSNYCDCDYVEISDGSSNQRYCGPDSYGDYYTGNGDNFTSIPGPFTFTGTITVKFISDEHGSDSDVSTGFLAVVCCSVIVTDLTTTGRLTNTMKL